MELSLDVYAKIKKPVAEVFDAVYRPEKLTAYFTTGGASAPMDAGTSVMWDFHDFPGAFPVHIRECVPGERLVFDWPLDGGEGLTRVTMLFQPLDPESTEVRIRETGWPETPEGIRAMAGNTGGWTQMLACLKVYLEHGVNLREFYY